MKLSTVPVASLRRHPDNARDKREYTKREVSDLAASIREHGLLQPLVVAPNGDGHVILAGHRRHAALLSLGIKQAFCVVLEGDERELLAVLLGENASHRAVDPLREAAAVARLVEGLTDEKHPYDRAATMLGKSVAWVRGRMRLTALTDAWRQARADAESPIHEWPVGYLELVAALPGTTQDEILEEWTVFESNGVPLLAELKSSLARSTCDLSKVPWDRDAGGIVDGAPACSACPFRASTQGVLFADDSKGDRCLNARCFASKRNATVAARIIELREKHGDALRVETTYGLQDVPAPEGTKVHGEFQLVPRPKTKGGFPVLRLRTLDVVYMAEAQAGKSGRDVKRPAKREGPRSLDEKRVELAKRRQIRALAVFCGAMLGCKVDVGTEKRPDETTPPEPQVPALPDVVGLVLAYGTGPRLGDGDPIDGRPDAARLATALAAANKTGQKDELATRARLWNRVREPIARALRVAGPMKPDAVADLAAQAETICCVCGLDWQEQLAKPAAAALAEPRSWNTVPAAARRRRSA